MSDPRKKLKPSKSRPSRPQLAIPPRGFTATACAERHDLRSEEINRLVQLLRAAVPWAEVRAGFDDVPAEDVDRYKPDAERLAAEAGPLPEREAAVPFPGRTGLRDHDVVHGAALLRGGATWPQVAAAIAPDVPPDVLRSWRPQIEALAAEPGPVARLPRPASPEQEEERKRRWLDSPGRRAGAGITVIGRHGPRRA